jgi:hypothetical protein
MAPSRSGLEILQNVVSDQQNKSLILSDCQFADGTK